MSLADRIKAARAASNMTQDDLAKIVGVSRASVAQWEAGDTAPSRKRLSIVADALGLTLQSLLAGGTVVELPRPKSKETKPSPDIASIPEIDIYAGMGGGGVYSTEYNHTDEFGNTVAADNIRHLWDLPANYVRYELRVLPEKASIIEVKGDSMAPTLTSGDRVMIDTSDTSPTPPGLFAVWDGTGVVVKRVEPVHRSDPPAIRLISDNEKHRPYECTADEARIIGRVIWFARRI